MEDESKGWEIQEYSPTSREDEDGKVTRRIVRRGIRIGKAIIVTGVVISSVPFVLPPLMVVSAVGLACSVPFGVFVASYACAEKLMSKLLPMPKPPPPLPLMLEYEGFSQADGVSYIDFVSEAEIYEIEEEEEEELGRETEAELDSRIPLQTGEDVDVEGVHMEEEGRLLEDTKATVEMRISLPVGKETETVPEDEYYEGKALSEEQKMEEVYQEDGETSALLEDQLTAISKTETSGSEVHPIVEILRQERPIDDVNIDDRNLAQKTHEGIVCRVVEVEGLCGLTVGALDPTGTAKEIGNADQGEQSMTINMEGNPVHDGPTSDTKEDSWSQFTRRAIKIDDAHNTEVEGRVEMSRVAKTTIYTPVEQIMKSSEHELADAKGNSSRQSMNVAPTDVELIRETPLAQKAVLDDQHAAIDATSTSKSKKKGKKKKPKSEETKTLGTVLNIHSEEHNGAISSNSEARNIADDSHLILVGEKKAGDMAQPNESGVTPRSPSGRSLKASPNKALISEEKIWENIEALRKIVGYRVARHQTCMEELKALYIFTGVEPPMSFKSSSDVTKDSPDLVEVNDKLRFLMAIIGVK